MSDPRRPAPLWPHLLACLALAILIDLGRHHVQGNADGDLPILVSLQKWTLFYWEQRRFGMLIPLLAMPVRSPFANLLLQNALTIFSGLAAGLLLARTFVGGRAWPLVGWFATALMLSLAPEGFRWRLLGTALPYGAALAFAIAGLLLSARARSFRDPPGWVAAAAAAFLLAHWMSPATIVVVLSLVWLPQIGAVARDPRRAWRDPVARIPSALALGAFAIATLAGRFHPYGHTHDDLLRPDAWPAGWLALAVRVPGMLDPFGWLGVAGALALAGLLIARTRSAAPASPALRSAIVLVGAGLVYWLFAGTLRWVVIQNRASPRYLIPSFQLFGVAAAIAALLPWLDRERQPGTGASVVAIVAAFGAALFSYGLPSLSGVRSDLDARLGRASKAVLAADCTHLTGDYWDVWPTVLSVNMQRYEAGIDDILWGVSYRSEPTRPEIRAAAETRLRLCAPHGADLRRARKLGLDQLVLVEEHGAFDVYSRAPQSTAGSPTDPESP